MIRLRILGSTELKDADGRELSTVLAQPKRLALLSYLAAMRGFHRRDTLVALFWPELDTARSRLALNQAVRFLRKELGGSTESVILSRGAGELGVDAGALWCDAAAFREHFEAKRYGEALDLYRGDLLPGLFSEQAAGFEEWVESERAHLRVAAARAATEVAEAREREHNYTTAVIAARRAVELAGLDERVVRDLLGLLDRLGDRAGAIHAYEEFAQRLARELEVEPATETKAVVEQIRKRVVGRAIAVSESASHTASPKSADASTSAPTAELVPGTEIGAWRIVRELGCGGMATVYMALDMKHDRRVALKVLRADLMTFVGTDRFLREIQITAQLAHPHIVPLLDSGSYNGLPYLVTPYVAGESLRARLDREKKLVTADALRLAGEIAEALDYAHRCGIVHRDIKPENILLADGHAIVADFGIARAIAAASPARDKRTTGARVLIGTPSYMSPEALRGEPVGAQTDIYALGCTIVEMLSGSLPGHNETLSSLMKRQAFVSRHIAKLASDCIAPVAENRPQTAADLARLIDAASRDPRTLHRRHGRLALGVSTAAALTLVGYLVAWRPHPAWSTARVESDRPRDVAVLYFDDLTPDKHLDHVAAGLTDDLVDRLSQVEGLRVVAPNAIQVFRDSSVTLDAVARRLNVATIVTGSIIDAGPLLRLTVRLVDARTGTQFRSRTAESPKLELFSMQDSVSTDVSLWLRDRLGREMRLRETQGAARSVEAWELVQRAEKLLRDTLSRPTEQPASLRSHWVAERLRSADSLLFKAQQLEPEWVDPMVRRARVELVIADGRPKRIGEVIALSDSVLQRSTNNAAAFAVRGEANLRLFQAGSASLNATTLRDAENDLGRALSARPDYATAWVAFGDALYADNRFADAVNAYDAALSTNHLFRTELLAEGKLFFASVMTGKFDDAEHWCRVMRSTLPNEPQSQMCQITLLGNRGKRPADVTAAWAEAQRVDKLVFMGPLMWKQRRMMVAAVLARAGERDSARAVIRRTAEQLGGARADAAEAYVHTLLGDRDSAIRILSQLVADFPRMRIGLARNPWYRGLQSDPRFRALALE